MGSERTELSADEDGNHRWAETIRTPRGELEQKGATNDITSWTTEYLIKSQRGFELWKEFYPVPAAADLSGIREARDRLGDRGIIRSHPFSPGQGSPWQSFCYIAGTEQSMFMAVDEPDFLHSVLEDILGRTLRVIGM